MKHIIIVIIIIALSIGIPLSFIGGVVYADKKSGIPRDAYFKATGYFTNFQKTELPYDGTDTTFINDTGASKEDELNYNNNPHNYAGYEADIYIKNESNYYIEPVWAVLPKTYVSISNGDHYIVRQRENIHNRKLWLNEWLNDYIDSISPGETLKSKIQVIIKTEGLSESDINKILTGMEVDLQLGICEKSLDYPYDISRDIYFTTPIFYKK